jgi:hypothetical protein
MTWKIRNVHAVTPTRTARTLTRRRTRKLANDPDIGEAAAI